MGFSPPAMVFPLQTLMRWRSGAPPAEKKSPTTPTDAAQPNALGEPRAADKPNAADAVRVLDAMDYLASKWISAQGQSVVRAAAAADRRVTAWTDELLRRNSPEAQTRHLSAPFRGGPLGNLNGDWVALQLEAAAVDLTSGTLAAATATLGMLLMLKDRDVRAELLAKTAALARESGRNELAALADRLARWGSAEWERFREYPFRELTKVVLLVRSAASMVVSAGEKLSAAKAGGAVASMGESPAELVAWNPLPAPSADALESLEGLAAEGESELGPGLVDAPFVEGEAGTLLDEAPLYRVVKRPLDIPGEDRGLLPADSTSLEVAFRKLSREDFETLKRFYGNPHVSYSPDRAYTLSDFLPPLFQATERTRLDVAQVNGIVQHDETLAPRIHEGLHVATDCWGVALEEARLRAHPGEGSFWVYQLPPEKAKNVFREYFDVVSEVPAVLGTGNQAPAEVLQALRAARPGDKLLVFGVGTGESGEAQLDLYHASTYLGAPTLSDGSRPAGGDLFMEKVGTDRAFPIRTATWNDVFGRYAGSEKRVLVVRPRPEHPLPADPRLTMGLSPAADEDLPEGLGGETTFVVGDYNGWGDPLYYAYYRILKVPLERAGERWAIGSAARNPRFFQTGPESRLPPLKETPPLPPGVASEGKGWAELLPPAHE